MEKWRDKTRHTVVVLTLIVLVFSMPMNFWGASDRDGDGYYTPDDCDDSNPFVYPGAEEFCDNTDNDCDGQIDEECYTCLIDWDGDSFSECNDCNDHDFTVYPGAEELCDRKDNDCDGRIDEDCCICFNDIDEDGYTDCWDCNDNDSTVHPLAEELCDGKDNDCDSLTDEGSWCNHVELWLGTECGAEYTDGEILDIYYSVHSSAPTAVVTITEYLPGGVERILISGHTVETREVYHFAEFVRCPVGLSRLLVTAVVTVGGTTLELTGECVFYVVGCHSADSDNDGYTSTEWGGDDCDDLNSRIHPGAEEICDGADNDCDRFIDEGIDCDFVEIRVDRDCGGYYDDREAVLISFQVHSSAPTAVVTITEYPPRAAPKVLVSNKPVKTNIVHQLIGIAKCRGLEKLMITAVVTVRGETVAVSDECGFAVGNCGNPDNDGDGYNWVEVGGNDCDDSNPDINPGAEEICDNIDNDCDGFIDEEPDKDGDGHESYDCGGNDCDDSDPNVYPGAEEIYDKKDNNCNGDVDEGITVDQIDDDNDGYTVNEDCNDKDSSINPGVTELCSDGKDNDCDGFTDCDDPDCELDSACERGFIDLTMIFSAIDKYKYFVVGIGAGAIAIVLAFIAVRMRKKASEERGKPLPEMAEEIEGDELGEDLFEV